MLKTTFGEQSMGRSQTFQWFSRFKAGRTSIDDDERSGRPVSSSTPEMIERLRQIIREDRRRTIDKVSMLVGISHRTCHKILTEDLEMRRVHQNSCPDSWVSIKNSNDLTFAWTSKKMILTTPAFFRMSLLVMKPGFTPTTRKPKFNPVNEKVRGQLDRRRQGKWEATSSQCWFVSLIRRELFTKNLFLLVKQLMLHSTLKFWNVYGRMCKGSDLISGRTTHGSSTMTMRQPMLPPDSTVFDR